MLTEDIIKRNKDGCIRKTPGRKIPSSNLILKQRSDDREIINNLPRSESIENIEFMEPNNSNNKESSTNDNEKALFRRRDLEIESLQEQITELHYERFIYSNNSGNRNSKSFQT